jgi:hypothetical protein
MSYFEKLLSLLNLQYSYLISFKDIIKMIYLFRYKKLSHVLKRVVFPEE